MKKYTLTAFICLSFALTTKAQESKKVIKAEPQISDVYGVLETMNIHLFRFDLRAFLTDVCNVEVYLDEYESGKAPQRKFITPLGKNIASLNDIPEEHREAFRKLKNVPEGKNEWENIKDLAIYITRPNDSTATATINVPNVTRAGLPMYLRPVGAHKTYFYGVRPFTFETIEKKESQDIPLLLYGSAWEDKKFGVVRFCGEKEISPQMKEEMLSNIPHYYVIGLTIKAL